MPGLGTFCYNVLPMGLKISPAVVQCFIDGIFRVPYDGPGPMHGKTALGNIVLSFMDDLIVFSDKKYHAHYLAFVIKILNKHNVGARPVKCDLGRERISFVARARRRTRV